MNLQDKMQKEISELVYYDGNECLMCNVDAAAKSCAEIAEAYALEVLKEVNLPYADNELLGRRVKNKINYFEKQLK